MICIVACGLLLASQGGCRAISRCGYACGRAFDPALRSARLTPTDAGPPCAAGTIAPAQHTDVIPAETVQLREETEHLKRTITEIRMQLDELNNQNAQRNQALIGTRAEVQRLEQELSKVRFQLEQWNSELMGFRQTLQARNDQRLAEVKQLAEAIETLDRRFAQAVQAATPPEFLPSAD